MSLLGIDMGSGSCKAVVFAAEGTILAQSAREYATVSPRPGWAEMDPEVFWEALVDVTREVAARVPSDPVEALASAATARR